MNAPAKTDARAAVHTPPQHFIGNRWTPPHGGQTLPMIDPSTGQPFAAIARGDGADIDVAVKAAREAFDGAWGALAPAEKGRLLGKLSGSRRSRTERSTRTISRRPRTSRRSRATTR